MKVAIYARVSTSDQNADMQLAELRQYVAARGWQIAGEYVDEGFSGTTNNRPMLKALLADVRMRKVDTVICWKLDRLFRSIKHTVLTLNEFQDLGVAFISLRDQIDMTTAAGRLMMHMVSAFSEFEASLIRERVKAGLANRKAKGLRLGREPRIDQGKVISLRKQGMSLSQIAKEIGSTPSGISKTLKKSGFVSPQNLRIQNVK